MILSYESWIEWVRPFLSFPTLQVSLQEQGQEVRMELTYGMKHMKDWALRGDEGQMQRWRLLPENFKEHFHLKSGITKLPRHMFLFFLFPSVTHVNTTSKWTVLSGGWLWKRVEGELKSARPPSPSFMSWPHPPNSARQPLSPASFSSLSPWKLGSYWSRDRFHCQRDSAGVKHLPCTQLSLVWCRG